MEVEKLNRYIYIFNLTTMKSIKHIKPLIPVYWKVYRDFVVLIRILSRNIRYSTYNNKNHFEHRPYTGLNRLVFSEVANTRLVGKLTPQS